MQVLSKPTRAELIKRVNDRCRTTFTGCQVVVTAAFAELDDKTKAIALHRVRTFRDFTEDNDPHHEHDMALFDVDSQRFFFKFDYYSRDMRHGSDDPSDMEKTRRVLTIGFASDY